MVDIPQASWRHPDDMHCEIGGKELTEHLCLSTDLKFECGVLEPFFIQDARGHKQKKRKKLSTTHICVLHAPCLLRSLRSFHVVKSVREKQEYF